MSIKIPNEFVILPGGNVVRRDDIVSVERDTDYARSVIRLRGGMPSVAIDAPHNDVLHAIFGDGSDNLESGIAAPRGATAESGMNGFAIDVSVDQVRVLRDAENNVLVEIPESSVILERGDALEFAAQLTWAAKGERPGTKSELAKAADLLHGARDSYEEAKKKWRDAVDAAEAARAVMDDAEETVSRARNLLLDVVGGGA